MNRPRAGYTYVEPVGLVHLPDLSVPDHDRLPVGFLADRFAEREAPEPRAKLLRPNPDWQAPRKFERRR